MFIILLGAPGSGKGTQGALLTERLGVPKISTGDLLRAAVKNRTSLGVEAQSFMDQGLLVPDEIILSLIEEVLGSEDARRGVIMDGFPRTIAQAEAVGALLAARDRRVDHVLIIDVPEAELMRRMLGRAAEQGRSDDTPETIQRRLDVYREQTAPLIAYYEAQGNVTVVPGLGSVEEIADRAGEALGA
ncbi:MAG TPA: adenylate kinase [Gemmatimonadales bacterium]